jgi:hypothetical protein
MRRGDPERIFQAQRTGLRNRIRDVWRVSQELADAYLDEWLLEAERRGLTRTEPTYWDDAAAWINEQISRR